MTIPIRVDIATENDYAALAKIEHEAFADEKMAQALFRNVTDPNARYNRALKWITKCGSDETMVVLKSTIGDEIAGAAIWLKPSKNLKLFNEEEKDPDPEGFDSELWADVLKKIDKAVQEVCGDQEIWYLILLATSPKHRGLGAATPLLRWGLDKADEQGLPAYLNASPLGKPVYLKYGFVVETEIKVYNDTITLPCMLRRPRKQ